MLLTFLVQLLILGSIQTAMGTISHPDDIPPDSGIDSNSLFYVDHGAQHQKDERNPSSLQWNGIDYLWTPELDGDEVDDQIQAKRAAQNFIRLGRNRNNNAFMRLGRSDQQGFIRFGRASPSIRDRRGFFGGNHDNLEHLMAAAGNNNGNDDNMRFGRRGDKFIRFGRSQAKTYVNNGNSNQNELDRENRKRKVQEAFIRLGRSRLDSNFIRLGKKSNGDSIHWGSNQQRPSGLDKNSQYDNDVLTPSIPDVDAFETANPKHGNSLGITDNDSSNEN